MRTFISIVIAAMVATEGYAGTVYQLEISVNGRPVDVKVTVDGSNVRADFERLPGEVVIHDSVLSRDGGKTFLAINNELRTWFRLNRSPFVLHANLSGITGKGVARNIKWSTVKSDREPLPDAPTHVGSLSYVLEERFDGLPVRIKCTALVKVWAMPDVDVNLWPARVPFATGIADVDAQIVSNGEFLREFPERIVVVTTRQFDGGVAMTETISARVADMRSVRDIAPDLFERPHGYVEQAPIIAAPGL